MKLVPVDPNNKSHVRFLWRLLRTRPPYARVSDKGKTTWKQHCFFVATHPYHDWCLIEVAKTGFWWRPWSKRWPRFAGSVFLSQPARPSVVGDELHVELSAKYRGTGIAAEALYHMMLKHPRQRYIANVATQNAASRKFFEKCGFRHCQDTFEFVVRPGTALWKPEI